MKYAIFPVLIIQMLVSTTVAEETQNLVKPQLLADVSAIEPGKPFTLGVNLNMAPHWHVYWQNAGASGFPTTVKFDLPEGFTAGEVQYPIPQRFEQAGNLISYGYEDETLLMATITPPKDLKAGAEVILSAKVGWLVCQESCVKGDANVKLALKVDAKPQAANVAIFTKYRELLPGPAAQNVTQDVLVDAPGGNFKSATGKLVADWKSPPEKVEWFPLTPDQLNLVSDETKTDGNKTTVTFKIEALAGEKVTDAALSSVLAYTVNGKRVGVTVPISLKSSKSKGS